MKIFGFTFTTKKELREQNAALKDELAAMKNAFPFTLGQIVYDIALKNDKGRYTKTSPSLEHSTISEVVVNEKNYFSLLARLSKNDVCISRDNAEAILKRICK